MCDASSQGEKVLNKIMALNVKVEIPFWYTMGGGGGVGGHARIQGFFFWVIGTPPYGCLQFFLAC